MARKPSPADARGLGDLAERLEQRGAEAIYLLTGDDRRAQDEALEIVRRAVVDPDAGSFGEVRLRGGESSVEDVLGACQTLPLLGERRLVVLREPEALSGGLDALAEYAADPCPSTTLVLLPAGLDRRLKAVKTLESASVVVALDPPGGAELARYIRRELEARGVTPSDDAVALLVDLVEADTLLLGHELEKLALYTAKAGRVERDDVSAVLGRTSTIEVWDLTNAIEDGRPDEAMRALHRLLSQGASVPMLVGILDWCLGRLLASAEPRSHPGRKRAIGERRRDLSRRAADVTSLLRDADRLVRTTGGNAEAALERAVLVAATPGARRPAS